MGINYVFHIGHAAVAYFNVAFIEQLLKFAVSIKVLINFHLTVFSRTGSVFIRNGKDQRKPVFSRIFPSVYNFKLLHYYKNIYLVTMQITSQDPRNNDSAKFFI